MKIKCGCLTHIPMSKYPEHQYLLKMSSELLHKAGEHCLVAAGARRNRQTQGEVILVQGNQTILPCLQKTL